MHTIMSYDTPFSIFDKIGIQDPILEIVKNTDNNNLWLSSQHIADFDVSQVHKNLIVIPTIQLTRPWDCAFMRDSIGLLFYGVLLYLFFVWFTVFFCISAESVKK
jgi:hypothetical protein